MTDEERRRTMDFILEQQAQLTAHFQQLKEDRVRERKQRAELRQSFQTLVELCRIHDIRLDDVEFRSITFEESVRRLDVLVKKNQARLDELERNKPR
jgi:hypothetical protein